MKSSLFSRSKQSHVGKQSMCTEFIIAMMQGNREQFYYLVSQQDSLSCFRVIRSKFLSSVKTLKGNFDSNEIATWLILPVAYACLKD